MDEPPLEERKKRPYLIITYHGYEGWSIWDRYETAEDALEAMHKTNFGEQKIVKEIFFKEEATDE